MNQQENEEKSKVIRVTEQCIKDYDQYAPKDTLAAINYPIEIVQLIKKGVANEWISTRFTIGTGGLFLDGHPIKQKLDE